MDRLQAMVVFARVVDEGGFAAAARALDMSPPVVTRVVADLEKHLNTRLLNRTTRKVTLTDAGDSYLRRVRTILQEVDDAEAAAAASTRDLQGTVHVLAPPTLATYFLAPLIPRWRERHPRLMLDITTDNFVSGRVDEFDVTLLVVPDDFDGNVVARKLFQGEAIVVASPGYLLRRGTPQQPEALESHDFLRDSGTAMRSGTRKLCLKPACGEGPAHELTLPVVLQSTSTDVLLRAVLDGTGIAVAPRLLVQRFLATGALVHVLPDWILSRYTIYAALPSQRMLPARTRAFLDFVSEQAPEAVAAQEG
ncbi:MAG: LysR family transcriptional regulator [Giesbergeria sp.]